MPSNEQAECAEQYLIQPFKAFSGMDRRTKGLRAIESIVLVSYSK